MEPVLMFTDKRKFEEMIASHSIHLGALNAVLAAYEEMKLPELMGAEFISLVQQPGTVVFDKMTNGGAVEIMGMQVDKQKAMELILKPSGYEEMIELITVYKKTANWDSHLHKVDIVNGEVVLHQSVIDKETEDSKVYAKTDKEKQAFQFAHAVIDAANKAFGDGMPYDLSELIKRIVYTEATPSGTFLMPLHKYSFEIRHRNIVGFATAGSRNQFIELN